MKRFKIYGFSSTIVVFMFAIALVLYIFLNNILVFFLALLVSFLILLLISAFVPKFYRKMSGSADMRDTALNSKKSEIVNIICKDCKETQSLIDGVSEEVDTDSAKSEMDRLGQELASVGCCSPSFEIEGDELSHVDLTFLTTKTTEIRDRLGAIKRSVANTYTPIITEKNKEREKAMKKLLDSGYNINDSYAQFESILSRSNDSLEDIVDNNQKIDSVIKRILTLSLEELQAIISVEKDRKGMDKLMTEFEDLQSSDLDINEVDRFCSIRSRIQSSLESDFNTLKESLLDSMEEISESSKCLVFSDFIDNLQKRTEAVRNISDPGKIDDLRKHEKEYRRFLKESLESMSKKITSLRNELSSYKVPRDMNVKVPNKLTPPNGSLSEITSKLSKVFSETCPNSDVLYRNIRIMRSYPKVEKLINHRLTESTKLFAKDIDIRYPEVFFLLYCKRHPKVKYVSSPEPKLTKK